MVTGHLLRTRTLNGNKVPMIGDSPRSTSARRTNGVSCPFMRPIHLRRDSLTCCLYRSILKTTSTLVSTSAGSPSSM